MVHFYLYSSLLFVFGLEKYLISDKILSSFGCLNTNYLTDVSHLSITYWEWTVAVPVK